MRLAFEASGGRGHCCSLNESTWGGAPPGPPASAPPPRPPLRCCGPLAPPKAY